MSDTSARTPRTPTIAFVQWADDAAAGPASGMTAWYKADGISGVADGVALSALHGWPDWSGHNHHLVAVAPGDTFPTFYSTTSAKLVNGRPAVWFQAGTDQILTATADTLPFNTTPLVVHAVAKTDGTSGFRVIAQQAPNDSPQMGIITSQWFLWWGSILKATGTADTGLHCFTFVYDPAGLTSIRLDGTQVGSTSSPGGTLNAGRFILGNNQGTGATWSNGPICEVVVYTGSTLTGADIAANEGYLKAKWGTP